MSYNSKGIEPFNVNPDFVPNFSHAKEVIESPLKKEWIKQRELGGKKLDYIEGGRVKKLLNEAFDYKWSFDIKSIEFKDSYMKKGRYDKEPVPQPPYVLVIGELIVPGFGSRPGVGSKVIQFGEGADQQSQAVKSALTDALKVAASNFGIALDLYLDDVEYDTSTSQPVNQPSSQSAAPKQPRGNVAQQYANATPQPPQSQNPWDKAMAEVERLKQLKQIMNINDNDGLVKFVEDWSKGTLKSWADITPDNIKSFNNYLESKLQG